MKFDHATLPPNVTVTFLGCVCVLSQLKVWRNAFT